jgi:hypothetical protein
VLGDVMTDDTYRDDGEKEEKREERWEGWEEECGIQSHIIKGKAKQESSSKDEDLSFDEMDDEKMTLFVKRFGKFMVKKGYHARRKKS